MSTSISRPHGGPGMDQDDQEVKDSEYEDGEETTDSEGEDEDDEDQDDDSTVLIDEGEERGGGRHNSGAHEDGNAPLDTENLETTDQEPNAVAQSGTHDEPALDHPTAFYDAAPATLAAARGPVQENTERNTRRNGVSGVQFFIDSLPAAARGLLSESSERLKTGGPAGQRVPLRAARREHVSFHAPTTTPSGSLGSAEEDDTLSLDTTLDNSPGAKVSNTLEIAKRALSLNMILQSNQELEPLFSPRGPETGTAEEPTRASLTAHHQLDQRSMPILPPIAQALSQHEVQGVGRTPYGPTLSPSSTSPAEPAHMQSLHHGHRNSLELVQPQPGTPGPLPAPTPSLSLSVSQQQDGHPSSSQFVLHFQPLSQSSGDNILRRMGFDVPWEGS